MFKENSLYYKPQIQQKADEVVVIDNNWYLGTPVPYEEGAREKFTVIAPSDTPYPFLIPSHQYMIKKSHRKKKSGYIFYHQIWSEIIAFKVGQALGVKTVPAYLARICGGNNPVYAVMCEWYYNYPRTRPAFQKNSGGDFFVGYVPNFDREKGKQHNLVSLKEIFDGYLADEGKNVIGWKQEFAEILLLDAIIGNTDRHQDNWELVYRMAAGGLESYLCPAFDNGTSLCYEKLDEKIATTRLELSKYINNKKATHHMRAAIGERRGIKFTDTISVIMEHLDMPKERIASILNVDIPMLEESIFYLKSFEVGQYSLSSERIELILDTIKERIRIFKEQLNSHEPN